MKIKQKVCKCGCGNTGFIWAKGMLKYCYLKSAKPKLKDEGLEQWFEQRKEDISKLGGICWECGETISPDYYRHATAHIFPKSIYKSVATNEHNYLCLCAKNGCHSTFDKSVEDAAKMKVWAIACKRYLLFKPLITETHKYQRLFEDFLS